MARRGHSSPCCYLPCQWGASQSLPARASAGELLGTKAQQGSTARAPAEAARPGWRQPSHLGEVVAAGAWLKDPASSMAQDAPVRSAEPLAAQTCPALLQAAPPHRSQAGAHSPAEGNVGGSRLPTHHAISVPRQQRPSPTPWPS